MPLAALVFDMDGTLFDSTACVTTAFREAVVAGGGPPYSADDVVAAYPLGPSAMILSHLLGRAATSEDEGRYLALLGDYEGLIQAYEGLAETLGQLVAASVPLAVFTGASHTSAEYLLRVTGLIGYFSAVVGGDEVPAAKPAPDGVLQACALLGVDPAQAAYVGDSPLDLEAARRSGALAVAAAWGHLFDAAAVCDVVASTPSELLALVGT